MENKPKIVVILGPTASGKSDLAVKLAKRFNGEVVSADSRQVYKGLDIGSGKITKREMRGVKHHLLDVASPKGIFTVQKYQRLTKVAMASVLRRKKLPIICGGTGLYIDSIVYNTQFPKVPPNLKLRRALEKLPTTGLFARISRLDPARAKTIDKHNRRRLIRAIEIVKATGKPIPALEKSSPYDVLKIGLAPEKKNLEYRIKRRLEKRLKIGMVKEVELLHKNGLSWKRLDDLGLEYRYISRYLRGIISYNEMKQEILKESYRYAKRQMTWFKKDKSIVWI